MFINVHFYIYLAEPGQYTSWVEEVFARHFSNRLLLLELQQTHRTLQTFVCENKKLGKIHLMSFIQEVLAKHVCFTLVIHCWLMRDSNEPVEKQRGKSILRYKLFHIKCFGFQKFCRTRNFSACDLCSCIMDFNKEALCFLILWLWCQTLTFAVKSECATHLALLEQISVTCLLWGNNDHREGLNSSFGSRRRKTLVPVWHVKCTWVNQVQTLH